MKITPLAHQVIGKLALIGLLSAPFALTPSYAAELVGKPVPVGAQAAAVAAAQASSEAQVAAKNAAVANGATATKAPIASVAPTPPSEPNAPDEPTPAEPPEAPELCAPNGIQGPDDIRKAIDELRDSIHHDMPSDFGGVTLGPDVIIPVIAMLLLFGGPILLLIVLAILHYRAKARRQQNINMNIDKLLAEGRDIPLEMLLGEEAAVVKPPVRAGVVLASPRDDSTMQKGVRNIGLGTGWLIFLTIMFGINIGSFGFIFIGLGISQLVIWKLSTTSSNSKTEAPESLKAQD